MELTPLMPLERGQTCDWMNDQARAMLERGR